MASASMYNSPFVYKRPLPKIKYPSLCSGCKFSFKHVLDSKFLAISALLLLIAIVINLIVIIAPFWFKLVLNPREGTFGGAPEKRVLTINTGIFFMNEDEMDNLVELNKNNNQDVVPGVMVFAQVLEVIGMCSLVACLAATTVLVVRRFASVTANFILAFFAALTGVFLVLAFLCGVIMSFQSSCDPYDFSGCNYQNNLKWRVFPIYTKYISSDKALPIFSQYFRVAQEVTPFVKLNWACFVSIIPAILALAASVLLWLEAFAMYKKMSQIRYTQLRAGRSPHEGDIDPTDHRKYVYRPPVQSGPMSYGMQPVAFQGGPYGQPYAGHIPPQGQQYPPQGQPYGVPTAPQHGVGFAEDPYEKKVRQSSSSSPPAGRRRSPPPARRRSSSPDSGDDSPPPTRFGRVGRGGGGSPPPRRRSPSPPSPSGGGRRRSPPPRRGGPPSINSSMSEGPFVSKEIDL